MEKIKVMLVEDDPRWQRDITDDLCLERDLEVVKVASSKEEAVEAAKHLSIDVILMDINLSESNLDGIEATSEITNLGKGIKIIMLTSLSEKETIVKAIEYGAINYVNKSSIQDILQCIREAYHNQVSLHPDATSAILREIRLKSLTPMEKNIYSLKEEGYTRPQMAEYFHTTLDTIGTHMKNISKKLKRRK
ncbi:response regulator transcription factor [Bacillus sp. S/N-304-OC-R1]|uniref:response regulator transcription factor n=1 Tax=Bacillus sp. S/N-304-OC-R1 TaxID=2758034 RepID=UPI001C8E38A0|nr:response regulator transcription factor [Bacillus sp. S/N-304-OC-R1]MBY0123537.1 response regulator transcription factor [Bacillus sp. S/N-304-OC-R1]